MRFVGMQFLCALSLRLKNVKNWLVLLLLPMLILGVTAMMPQTQAATTVTVGVALPEDGAEDFWKLLSEHNNGILTFVKATPETIDRNVASGHWDCGLVLAEDFSRQLEDLEMRKLITLRISSGSAVYPLVRESVSSCLAQLAGPSVAREYLLESGIVSEEGMPTVQFRLEGVLGEADRVLVTMKTMDGKPLEVPELTRRGMDRFLCWLIAAVIVVRMVFGAADLGKWSSTGTARCMGALRPATQMLTARAAADAVLMMASGAQAVLLLKGGIWGLLAVFGYTLFWLTASVLLARWPRVHPVMPVLVPFGIVISFLLSPVLMDVSVIFPALSGVTRWLPATLFLQVWSGEGTALGMLLMAALLCLLCSCLIDRCKDN